MDKKQYKKIETFKSGRFILSWQCSKEQLAERQAKAYILHDTINDLPVLPQMKITFKEDLIRSIYGTAAIEGNPLSEKEVGELYHKKKQGAKSGIQHVKEIYNLKAAYAGLDVGVLASFEINEKYIRQVHKTVTQDIGYQGNNPGNYRNFIVKVGDKSHGGVYTPPKCLPDIEKLMKEYIIMLSSEPVMMLGPFVRAALAHYYLGMIHPFADGNGRVARLIEATLLMSYGYKYAPVMLANYYHRNLDEYYLLFSTTRKAKGDVTPFVIFCLDGIIECYQDIKQRMVGFITKLALKDYYVQLMHNKIIFQRQYDLLVLLLEHTEPIPLTQLLNQTPFAILYRNKSDRTARRDLQTLVRNELVIDNNGRYQINLRALS
jgi:Fic family protein